jgi:hypothetical protein
MGVDRRAAAKLGPVRARPVRSLSSVTGVALSIAVLSAVSCARGARPPQPSIAITEIPPAAQGGSERMDRIAGRVDGVKPGQAVVLFSRSGVWYVQPRKEPLTMIVVRAASWEGEVEPRRAVPCRESLYRRWSA